MKRIRKTFLVLLFALVLALGATLPLGCGGEIKGNGDKIEYTVTFTRSGGQAFENISIYVENTDTNLEFSGRTNKNGTFKFTAPKDDYRIEVGVPEGYKERWYKVDAKQPDKTFKLSASIISEPASATQVYSLGSVMHDFTYTDTLGRTDTLSNLLKTKKMVLINLWYINCSYCVQEFPDMQEAYDKHKANGGEILAFNDSTSDTLAEIEAFRQNTSGSWAWDELTFPMIANDTGMGSTLFANFNAKGSPTTALIDREGVVCMIGSGAGTLEEFEELFVEYCADDYTQRIQFPVTELPKPNVPSPSSERISAAIGGEGFTATYSPASDAYNWPWIIGSDNKSIVPSNTGYQSSHSILNITFQATEDQILAFDYKTSTESYDKFYVYADDDLVATYGGIMSDYKTCYAYVPLKAGKYVVSIAYIKDSNKDAGDDSVCVKNMRFVDAVGERVEIPYRCAGGDLDTGGDFTEYVTPVYNETDGFYHVGDANGPLVIAELYNPSKWSDRSVWDIISGGVKVDADLDGDGEDEEYAGALSRFVTISYNGVRNGKMAVTPKLRDCLRALVLNFGNKHGNENEWLDLCYYYVVYGGEPGEQVDDPARGCAFHTAVPSVITPTDAQEPTVNTVVKSKPLMPRGIFCSIVPEETGVYRIRSIGDVDTEGWLIGDPDWTPEKNALAANDTPNAPMYKGDENFSISYLLQKGKKYCVMIDFKNVDALGEIDYVVEKLGAEGSVWTPAAEGGYTMILDENDNIVNFVVSGAVDYVLGDDDCYHVKNSDGSAGPLLYVNMTDTTNIFPSQSLEQIVSINHYYCTQCGAVYPNSVKSFEDADGVLCYCGNTDKSLFKKNKAFNLPTPLTDTKGNIPTLVYMRDSGDGYSIYQYIAMYDLNTEDDIGSQDKYLQHLRKDGIKFTDYTPIIEKNVVDAKNANKCAQADDELGGNAGEPYMGYVPATKELVDVLQKLIIWGDYSVSVQLTNSWLQMANYFLPIG